MLDIYSSINVSDSQGRLAQWKTVHFVISHFRYGPSFESALRQELFGEWQIKMRDPNSSKYVGDLATSTQNSDNWML